MPACCKFTDRKTDQLISLIDLDEILCKEMGIKPSENEMCMLYDLICIVGIAITSTTKRSVVTQEDFDNHMAVHGDSFTNFNKLRMERFLVTDYKFETWYQRKS